MKTQKITIPACLAHQGFLSIQAEVPWNCIYCGVERGSLRSGFSFDGSRRLTVSLWTNPCGHVESYEAVRQWLKAQAELLRFQQDGELSR